MQTAISPPALSITVTNYNYGYLISRCLNSILEQTFGDFEVIFINDNSTDDSLDAIQPYLHDCRVRLINHSINEGVVASLIEGANLSRGRYITVISADDWIVTSDAFARQVAVLEQHPEVAFVYTAYGVFEDEGKCNYIWRAAERDYVRPGREVFREMVLNYHLLHTGTMIRKTAYQAVGGYDPRFRYAVDPKMWLGLCHAGQAAYINDVLYAYWEHRSGLSKSAKAIGKSIEEVLAAIDWSFGLLPAEERKHVAWLRRKAERKALIDFAADKIFSNYYRAGWQGYWMAVKIRPAQTILQRSTAALVLRTALRQRGYRWLEQTYARLSLHTRDRLRLEADGLPIPVDMPTGTRAKNLDS